MIRSLARLLRTLLPFVILVHGPGGEGRDEKASALLERAARAQGTLEGGREVEDLQIDLSIRSHREGQGFLRYYLYQYYQAPERIRTEISENPTANPVVEIFDGSRYFVINESGTTELPNTAEFKESRREIRERLELTRLLLKLFLLDNLARELSSLVLVDDGSSGNGAILEGVARNAEEAGFARIRLSLDLDTLRPSRVELAPSDRTLARQTMSLDKYKRVSGVWIPHKVSIRFEGEKDPRHELTVVEIQFNPGVPDEKFRPEG